MTNLPEPRQGGALWSPTLRLLNQLLHLFAAAVSVGVPFFLAVFMIPRLEAQGAAETIPNVVDRFYSVLPWVTLAVFFTTGFFNFLFWLADSGYGPKESLGTTYVRALILKVVLAHVLVGFGIAFGFSGAPHLGLGPLRGGHHDRLHLGRASPLAHPAPPRRE